MRRFPGSLFSTLLYATILTACSSCAALNPSISVALSGGPLGTRDQAVILLTHPTDNPHQQAHCTGFYVAATVVATAGHCVVDGFPTSLVEGDETFPLELLYRDTENDIAILETDRVSRMYLRMAHEVSVGQMVWVYSRGTPHRGNDLLVRGIISNPQMNSWDDKVLIGHHFLRGQSGSPIVDSRGYVVSIAVQAGNGLGVGAAVRAVEALLARA